MRTTFDEEVNLPGKEIYRRLVKGTEERLGRQLEAPFACFLPVSVQTKDGRRCSALSREISTSGIGLVHNMELPLCEVELSISHERRCSVRVRVQIAWCRACGDGWYLSGTQFLNAGD
jgi:hypothetical protein